MTDLQREAKIIADFFELDGFKEYQVCKDAIALLRRIERGELVEVPRCLDCRWRETEFCELGDSDEDCPCGQARRKPDE